MKPDPFATNRGSPFLFVLALLVILALQGCEDSQFESRSPDDPKDVSDADLERTLDALNEEEKETLGDAYVAPPPIEKPELGPDFTEREREEYWLDVTIEEDKARMAKAEKVAAGKWICLKWDESGRLAGDATGLPLPVVKRSGLFLTQQQIETYSLVCHTWRCGLVDTDENSNACTTPKP